MGLTTKKQRSKRYDEILCDSAETRMTQEAQISNNLKHQIAPVSQIYQESGSKRIQQESVKAMPETEHTARQTNILVETNIAQKQESETASRQDVVRKSQDMVGVISGVVSPDHKGRSDVDEDFAVKASETYCRDKLL